ncbi:ribonuclease Z [Aquibacillus halophilus]|uniref:Ribonuclease Z n=1 Tax=Aquibacillus halophilus TaxID=930132 RepID=A0A6A8DHD9_9BACI|nr:ribonuclease Z [Aquibacillus halophilus]MRH42317.1 ribonuclease Z [Aquibacillus halophilus]
MRLVFLGTGAGVPSKQRNVSAIALEMLQELGSIWLFDCGEATQHQILHTNIRPGKIEKIFITHLHGDHIYGLPGFLSSRSFQGGVSPLTIYGPKGIKEFIETSLRVSGSNLSYPLIFEEVFEGLIEDNDRYQVVAKKLDHGVTSFGYQLIEKDKPGQLQPERLIKAGIKPGPIFQKIKENNTVILDNGDVLLRDNYIGPNKPGRKITILGDTKYIPEHSHFVNNSDVLVHEATFAGDSEELAQRYHHSTTIQAAILARDSSVGRLILTHISSRYQKEQQDELLFEARSIFNNTDVAYDLFEIDIPAKE